MTATQKQERAPLTERQQEVYDFIRQHIEDWQRPPTYRDMTAAFGITLNAIRHQLGYMHSKGWIEVDEMASCGIRLTNVKVTIEDL
jgi:repressor LexA